MKPFKIFIFFMAIAGLLLAFSLVFPEDGIAFGEDFKLRFISGEDMFSRDSFSRSYTDSLIINTLANEDPEFGDVDTVFIENDSISDIKLDSILKVKIDSISKRVYPIEFQGKAKEDLYSFFRRADRSRDQGKLTRILHYGDSQIENDRMTALLRYRFQKVFGGTGCGMVPAIPLYSGNPTFKENYQGDWIRYTGFGKRDSTLDHNAYGMMDCFSSIPLPAKDDIPALNFEFIQGRRASKFSQMKLFLHSYLDSGMLVLHLNDTITDTISNIPSGFQVLNYKPAFNAKKLRIDFNFREGGRVYGISFDPLMGIQMDNIAMRGSAGIEFRRSDSALLDTMMKALNPGLLLMQFGGNVVPYISNVSYYKTAFKKELIYLKQLFPGISIIVIGPSDMATKENGKFITYEKLEPIRDVLREAAMETGCAFWDMYEAMGGEGSIQDFVLADPPLANPDYIHFTPKGANMIAGMFFDAVMLEYNKYRAGGKSQQAMLTTN